jgi:hypothetical protein
MSLAYTSLEDALRALPAGRHLQIELSYNLFNSDQKLMHLRHIDPVNPRRKPVDLLGAVIVGESHAELLRSLAGALDLVNGVES